MGNRVSSHLHGLHKALHEDRAAAIENCKTALDKAAGMEPNGGPMTTFLKAEIARHQPALDYHAAGMEECGKAITAEDLTKRGDGLVEPTSVSAVTPDRPGITMVPRFGQQAPPEKSPVPEQFAHLVKIEDAD